MPRKLWQLDCIHPLTPKVVLCSLPVLLNHVQQRAAADMLLLAQADASGAAAAVQDAVQDTASSSKGGFFNFFASAFEATLKACLLQPSSCDPVHLLSGHRQRIIYQTHHLLCCTLDNEKAYNSLVRLRM